MVPHSLLATVSSPNKDNLSDDDTSAESDVNQTCAGSVTDNTIIPRIIQQLSALELHLRTNPPQIVPKSLEELYNTLSAATNDITLAPMGQILTSVWKVAPNQHSWPETRAVMNVSVKSKKRMNEDPYGGGEKSGKKAKKDAREPKDLIGRAIPAPVPTTSQVSQPPTSGPIKVQANPVDMPIAALTQFPPQSINLRDPSLLRDTAKLRALKRHPHLNDLARIYHVSAGGSNEAVIARLQNPAVNMYFTSGPPPPAFISAPTSQPSPFGQPLVFMPRSIQ